MPTLGDTDHANPIICTVSIHPVLMESLRDFAKSAGVTLSAGARMVLHHFLVPGQRNARVQAALEAPKADRVTKPGLFRLHTLGVSISTTCAEALKAKALVTPNPAPTERKPMSDANDVARAIFEAVFLSPADRKLVLTRVTEKPKRAKADGTTFSVYLSAVSMNQLSTLLEKAQINKSYYVALLIEDAMHGTNKAARVLALPPDQQPTRRTMSADKALG